MEINNKKPKKSLRTMLMLWFLLFSIAPLAFITGYSVVKYEQAIDQEQLARLEGNYREIQAILSEFEGELTSKIKRHSASNSLIYYLSQSQSDQAREIARDWLSNTLAHRLSLFNREGLQEVALYKNEKGEVQRRTSLEGKDVYLSEDFLKKVTTTDVFNQIEIRKATSLDLISFAKVRNRSGRLVGYIEEIIELDKSFLKSLNKRMNLEILFFSANSMRGVKTESIVSSHDDLELYKPDFFAEKFKKDKDSYFELPLREVPYGFIVRQIKWGGQNFYIALGTSKQAVKAVLQNVNYAFFLVVAGIIVVLVLLSLVISNLLLKPVSNLLEVIQKTRPGEEIPEVKMVTDTELGLLAESFNSMSKKVNKAQEELKGKVDQLEKANQEIRETQAKLVHTGKMASLGQLVAGVAHELNNPIGFIYSNMGHLREYSNGLIKLASVAEKDPKKIPKLKEEIDFEYLVKDLPKLIKSCEEGAKRTRDIVLGLRNFSRLEEAKLKEVNIEESLDNTLNLLSGELKSRIKVVKKYSGIPKVNCYPSQLNQVFMNILSNAAQAIEDKGTIEVVTQKKENDKVEISIRDTGKGMDKKTQEQIFDPFFTTKSLGQGTGLGLSISYGIVQKHGGDIQVESEKGKGTSFRITLSIKGPSQP